MYHLSHYFKWSSDYQVKSTSDFKRSLQPYIKKANGCLKVSFSKFYLFSTISQKTFIQDESQKKIEKFCEDCNIGKLKFLVVNKYNDQFGITDKNDETDIKLIFVDNSYLGRFIGKDGKILSNPNKDTIIYTTLNCNKALLSGNFNKTLSYLSNIFYFPIRTKKEDKSIVWNIFKEYNYFLKNLIWLLKIKNSKANTYLEITGKTQGVQTIDRKGNKRHSLINRLISNDPESLIFPPIDPNGQNTILKISSSNEKHYSWDDYIKMPGGMLFFERQDHQKIKVYNRYLTLNEKNSIINIFKYLSIIFNSEINNYEKDLILVDKYINGIINVNAPSVFFDYNNKSDELGENRFWFDAQYLYKTIKSNNKIIVLKFKFTLQELEREKENILYGVLHYMNFSILHATTYNDKNFNEIKIRVENGNYGIEIVKTWDTYLSYLVGKTDATDDLQPLTTNINEFNSDSLRLRFVNLKLGISRFNDGYYSKANLTAYRLKEDIEKNIKYKIIRLLLMDKTFSEKICNNNHLHHDSYYDYWRERIPEINDQDLWSIFSNEIKSDDEHTKHIGGIFDETFWDYVARDKSGEIEYKYIPNERIYSTFKKKKENLIKKVGIPNDFIKFKYINEDFIFCEIDIINGMVVFYLFDLQKSKIIDSFAMLRVKYVEGFLKSQSYLPEDIRFMVPFEGHGSNYEDELLKTREILPIKGVDLLVKAESKYRQDKRDKNEFNEEID